jgi:hypothetical protein
VKTSDLIDAEHRSVDGMLRFIDLYDEEDIFYFPKKLTSLQSKKNTRDSIIFHIHKIIYYNLLLSSTSNESTDMELVSPVVIIVKWLPLKP